MTSTEVAALPKSGDSSTWTEGEKALVEAAGLVTVDRNGQKTLADRPVVESFLAHCHRTGLNPIARQIYCLPRKSRGATKWTIQISIDGARLVAERTGAYEGQTPVQWTSDGVTWADVWLAAEPPKAARVGVYRRGFREALYAVARWDSYAVFDTVWENGKPSGQKLSSMWAKMPDLMLGKVAEMLALRKAFPQDLSGLYSSEEMDQARDTQQAPQIDTQRLSDREWVVWKERLDGITTKEHGNEVFLLAKEQGALGKLAPTGRTLSEEFRIVAANLKAPEPATPEPEAEEVVDATIEPEPGVWADGVPCEVEGCSFKCVTDEEIAEQHCKHHVGTV